MNLERFNTSQNEGVAMVKWVSLLKYRNSKHLKTWKWEKLRYRTWEGETHKKLQVWTYLYKDRRCCCWSVSGEDPLETGVCFSQICSCKKVNGADSCSLANLSKTSYLVFLSKSSLDISIWLWSPHKNEAMLGDGKGQARRLHDPHFRGIFFCGLHWPIMWLQAAKLH